MTYEEAINWIAFGQVSEADLTGKAKFGAKWVAAYAENDIRQTEPSEDGSDCAVLRVLRALAETVPVWTSNAPRDANWQRYSEAHPEADFVPPAFQEVEYAARDLIRKYGRSAAELAVEMQADLNTYAKCKAQEAEAERGLDAAQIDGLLRAAERQPTPRFKGVDILELWPNPKLEEGEPRNLPQSRMLREAKRWAAQRLKAWPKDHAPPRQAQDWETRKSDGLIRPAVHLATSFIPFVQMLGPSSLVDR